MIRYGGTLEKWSMCLFDYSIKHYNQLEFFSWWSRCWCFHNHRKLMSTMCAVAQSFKGSTPIKFNASQQADHLLYYYSDKLN